MNLDGALCLRSLVTGVDAASGRPLTGDMLEKHLRVKRGMEETRLTGKLGGKPLVIVNGRSDALLPPNHSSRAYYRANKLAEPASQARYYEVTNAHHLDVLNGVGGFDSRWVPLNVYFVQALNLMWEHLKAGRALPPSQVVRTRPREQKDGKTVPIAAANVPRIEQALGPNARISVGLDGALRIPD
jgi:hydroxybutyrate-dimer hydrolase